MKSWHVTVLDRCKEVRHKEFFDVKLANETHKNWKEEFAKSNPKFLVLKEEY